AAGDCAWAADRSGSSALGGCLSPDRADESAPTHRKRATSSLTSPPLITPVGVRRERLDAAIYFAGTLFQRLSLFLALPLLLHSLSAAEYGTFGLLQSAVNLLPA